ncbi:MAG: PAS domain-containing sensor histidine kinase [Actinomycetota bacterium]|nr:PAS domain-containing sensor histidine kinase [Actinomycetota bacterium]
MGLVLGSSAALVPVRGGISRAAPALVLVVPIVLAGLVGGRLAALVTAAGAALAFNVAFLPPHWTLVVHAPDDFIALAVFAFVAVVVGTLVAREGERRQSAEERAVELQALNDELRTVQAERQRLAEEAMRTTVLERVDEQRAALLRSVSHDLRTPLAAIRAVVSDLLGGAPYDDATRTDLLGLVADEVERLDRLVANLLSLSRIEAGALHPDRQVVAVDELVADSVYRLGRLLVQRRLQIELPPLPLVLGDYTQLSQVLSNLLQNAARHAPPNSTIRIGGREVREFVEVWVDDEGMGVIPPERTRIFEPFRRGEGSSSSGIGLAICKAIVEAHGGRIAVVDSPVGGARFCFTLPKAP